MNKITLKNIISSSIKQKSLEEENLFDKDIFLKTVYETISSIEDNHSDIMICDYEHEASNMKVDAFELISDMPIIKSPDASDAVLANVERTVNANLSNGE